MSGTRTQRIIAFILLISPWIYIPSVFKEIIFIALAIALYVSTLDLRKKKETRESQGYEMPTSPLVL